MSSSLEVPIHPERRLQDSRLWRVAAVGGAVVLVLAWTVWYAVSPEALPTVDRSVEAPGVVGEPVYVGMYHAPVDVDRTLQVSGVKVHTSASVELRVQPLLCRGGAFGVTTDPGRFCSDLVDPEGQELRPGDSVVVAVTADEPATAVVDRIRIAYRDGFSWDTQPAGIERAVVTVAPRADQD